MRRMMIMMMIMVHGFLLKRHSVASSKKGDKIHKREVTRGNIKKAHQFFISRIIMLILLLYFSLFIKSDGVSSPWLKMTIISTRITIMKILVISGNKMHNHVHVPHFQILEFSFIPSHKFFLSDEPILTWWWYIHSFLLLTMITVMIDIFFGRIFIPFL